jgi:hypothetical protein
MVGGMPRKDLDNRAFREWRTAQEIRRLATPSKLPEMRCGRLEVSWWAGHWWYGAAGAAFRFPRYRRHRQAEARPPAEQFQQIQNRLAEAKSAAAMVESTMAFFCRAQRLQRSGAIEQLASEPIGRPPPCLQTFASPATSCLPCSPRQ